VTAVESTPEVRHVVYAPRDPHEIATAFGPGVVSVGAGFDQVVLTCTPAAAQVLARIVAAGSRADALGADGDQWCHVVVDLLTSAALSDPQSLPLGVPVPLLRDQDLANLPQAPANGEHQ
jgi:hypothetical protein